VLHRLAGTLGAAALSGRGTAVGAASLCGALAGPLSSAASADTHASPIAVASSLRFVWEAVHRAAGQPALRASFGASRTLARQMLQGAPYQMLLSADTESIDLLIRAGLADERAVLDYAQGRLSWLSPASDAPRDAASLVHWWRAKPSRRLAIAHPDHAPYGRAAVQALQALSIGPLPPTALLRGENAAQALQFFLTGAADAALLPVSLARHAEALAPSARPASWQPLPIDPALHDPLTHRAVAVRGAGPAARQLLDALPGEPVQQALRSAGFAPIERC